MPLILCLNMSDEADQMGMVIDHDALTELLGIEVIRTVAPEVLNPDCDSNIASMNVIGVSSRMQVPLK